MTDAAMPRVVRRGLVSLNTFAGGLALVFAHLGEHALASACGVALLLGIVALHSFYFPEGVLAA